MKLNIVDKHNVVVPFEGFVLVRVNGRDIRKGSVYPYGFDEDANVVVLDDAKELTTLDYNEYLAYEEGAHYVTMLKPFKSHGLMNGDITRAHENLIDRDINSGCIWVQSFGIEHDYFATRKSTVKDFVRALWTAQAYRYRMQAAQELAIATGVLKVPSTTRYIEITATVGKINKPFVPEEAITSYVTVEFTPGGKQYTYLLPNHLTAVKGDDAVVVVNNPNYPELKGTKIVRITGVYDRNPSEYYDSSLKRIEHVVSKSAERRKELEQKINDKRIQLEQAAKHAEIVANQLTKLEQDLVNENY